ncbi:MAG: lipid-A-disaccharide synthase [Desulfosarcina sp.]|nr:lipid-A-disaccharide synthase [Desulfobacterales bacterium]
MMPPAASAPSELPRHPSIMIVSGEASGDLHGAKLAESLLAADGRLSLFGIGGDRMRAAGVRVAVDARQLGVVGITEIGAKLPGILRGWRAARHMLAEYRPDLLILIDFPDFNLCLARYARRWKPKILYYISPQIWAWRRKRVKQIRRLVDYMAVILPFEADFYRRHGVPVSFVGHPLMDQEMKVPAANAKAAVEGPPTIGLLPGSRDSEVARLLPALLAAAARIRRRMDVRFLLSRADTIDPHRMDRILGRCGHGGRPEIVCGDPASVFLSSTLVIAASGTVTLEAALYETPMMIVYRVSSLSYHLGKALIRVPHIGLVNLIAGKRIVPEFIQHDVNPEAIADAALALLMQPHERKRMRTALAGVKKQLGAAGASARVARIALSLMSRSGRSRPEIFQIGAPDQCL